MRKSKYKIALGEYEAIESATARYTNILQNGWKDFDDKTCRAQAFLIGKALWQSDRKLTVDLHDELDLGFGSNPENLELLGFYLPDFGRPRRK